VRKRFFANTPSKIVAFSTGNDAIHNGACMTHWGHTMIINKSENLVIRLHAMQISSENQ
jgi:hypothetical protein